MGCYKSSVTLIYSTSEPCRFEFELEAASMYVHEIGFQFSLYRYFGSDQQRPCMVDKTKCAG